jgi:extradiol dioxygenase family protein
MDIQRVRVDHIAILVKDIDKARKFYGCLLGLRELKRPDFFVKGIWYELGGFELHLMLCEEMRAPQAHPISKTVQPHFAMSMSNTDFNKFIEKLKHADICHDVESGEINKNLSNGESVMKQTFFYDYDGNMIEVNNKIVN